jgi:hypothetical protein
VSKRLRDRFGTPNSSPSPSPKLQYSQQPSPSTSQRSRPVDSDLILYERSRKAIQIWLLPSKLIRLQDMDGGWAGICLRRHIFMSYWIAFLRSQFLPKSPTEPKGPGIDYPNEDPCLHEFLYVRTKDYYFIRVTKEKY